MSGIVGIVNTDRQPVDPQLLERMTRFMVFRGPDAQNRWIDGHVGFGHTMLRTTKESEQERQPFSLDGEVWITADARVDDRQTLARKLKEAGRTHLDSPTDVELLLHAYHVWGESCVEHLIGDFAFAIWDRPRQRLFGARDHLGLKPFYYSHRTNCLLISNTLNCLRQHPVVCGKLNEVAIGDFLLFDANQNPTTTTFADIQCLPPAHTLTWSEGSISIRRYWTLPIDDLIRYRRAGDYVDQFLELLHTVVSDRLRTERVAVYMSGGLDSTAVAATARHLCDVRAYTVVYDTLIPDEERYYTTLAARRLNIAVEFFAADDYLPMQGWDESVQRSPEPDNNPFVALHTDQIRQALVHGRVALNCEGPDNLLQYEWQPYVTALIEGRQLSRLLRDFAFYVTSHKRIPFLRQLWQLDLPQKDRFDSPRFPEWLNAGFVTRTALDERWKAIWNGPVSNHPLRPKAAGSLQLARWRYMFESNDPGATRLPAEMRFPFMDLRMVRYMLALPAVPWCRNKHVERVAMRGVLPEKVRRRPKSPLAGDPVSQHLRKRPELWQRPLTAQLDGYVDKGRLRRVLQQRRDSSTIWTNWTNLRPFALSNWLETQPDPSIRKETYDESDIHQEAV